MFVQNSWNLHQAAYPGAQQPQVWTRWNSINPQRAAVLPFAIPQPTDTAPLTVLLGLGMATLAIYTLVNLFDSDQKLSKTCSVCNRPGHDRRTCPYEGERLGFSRSIPKSWQCECCGSSHYEIQRHHTRGRPSRSDFLDVCCGCHVECCHGGSFQNLGSKPRTCRITGRPSYWCN